MTSSYSTRHDASYMHDYQDRSFTFLENMHRRLDDENEVDTSTTETWKIIYMGMVLLVMFVALLSDRVGADMVMMLSLTLCMAAKIITVPEGLAGFANEGIVTVLVLFVVAQGISVTGALDWYMGKLLGRPKRVGSAQLRLMIPIGIISAFLNNTPVVVVMIPIVQRWGKNLGMSPKQLLIPLSFASILGGTCTLIGTSTNLVVVGLLNNRYPDDESLSNVGLFELGKYGIPVAFAGLSYVLLVSPYLLPDGNGKDSGKDGSSSSIDNEDVLLGARMKAWSPGTGRTVKRSGLRETGGLFLVSVYRCNTGNLHRAVGPDFVLNEGDVLYFTGLVEGFGEFCAEHGLEVVTNEVTLDIDEETTSRGGIGETSNTDEEQGGGLVTPTPPASTPNCTTCSAMGPLLPKSDTDYQRSLTGASIQHHQTPSEISTVVPVSSASLFSSTIPDGAGGGVPCEIGETRQSLLKADEVSKLRSINRLTDLIRGAHHTAPIDSCADEPISTTAGSTLRSKFIRSLQGAPPEATKRQPFSNRVTMSLSGEVPPTVVVVEDKHLVIVGVNAKDRIGLLLDISKTLKGFELQLHHTEAAVVGDRSVSVWRCESTNLEDIDVEKMWVVVSALLASDNGTEAVRARGMRVKRTMVTQVSDIIGRTAEEVDFRDTFKAAIISIQKKGKNVSDTLSTVKFDAGDVLILQVSDDSPLLLTPPEGFYENLAEENIIRKSGSAANLKNMLSKLSKKMSSEYNAGEVYKVDGKERKPDESKVEDQEQLKTGAAWHDLQVMVAAGEDHAEFLTAMQVAPNSQLAKKTAAKAGIDKLPGVFLVSIDRPAAPEEGEAQERQFRQSTMSMLVDDRSVLTPQIGDVEIRFEGLSRDEALEAGDILWFSGSASDIGNLRKVPGLLSFDNAQVDKLHENVHDRRLVQAVIARRGPLAGKTIVEVRFRTRYGAAVIAVHREGQRVHEHPGQIKLQAGDVLLLEAGPTFFERGAANNQSFALLSEVDDSTPPRLSHLVPALLIAAAMLIAFTAGVASLLVCALVAAMIMLFLGILSQQEARDAVNWEVYVTIAAAFGIGTALTNSGVADGVANGLVDIVEALDLGDYGLYAAVYLATFLISNVVTNNAAAALLFPIAMQAAEDVGADRLLMAYCLMLSASASFMSPFGYTTNLLIYGPGGYKYKDFVIFGTPLQILLWILTIALLSSGDWWYTYWIGSGGVLAAVAFARATPSFSRRSSETQHDHQS